MADTSELHPLGQQLPDALTGLPNQQFFGSTMEGALSRAGPDSRLTVCMIDLDGFAVINDGFSREIGDQVLRLVRRVAQRPGDDSVVAHAVPPCSGWRIVAEPPSTSPASTPATMPAGGQGREPT